MIGPATILARAAASSTVVGPVTLSTTFSPAASCGDVYISGGVLTLGAPEATSVSSCFPSGWASETTQYFTATAPICPQGYSMNTGQTLNIGALTATTGTCCPSDYSTQTASPYFNGERCTSKIYEEGNMTVTTQGPNGIGFTTTVLSVSSGDGLNAYGVAIQWQVPASTTSSSSSSTSSTTSASPASSTSASSPTSTSTGSASSGLSTGAKAGIGVGVSIGGLLILAGLAAFFFRRRKAQQGAGAVNANGADYGGYVEGTSELATEQKSPGQQSVNTAYGGPPAAYGQQGYYAPVPQGSPHSTNATPAQNGWQQSTQQHELAGGHEMHELDGGATPGGERYA